MIGRKRIRATLLASTLAAAAALIPAGAARAAAPEWKLSLSAAPNSFAAGSSGDPVEGPAYHLTAINGGDGATSGPYTLTDTLPAELTPASGIAGEDSKGNPLSCETIGQTVTCTGTVALAPGERANVTIPVDVAADASGKTLLDEATVGGGGAALDKATIRTAVGLPAWRLIVQALPTNFKPGSVTRHISVIAFNAGAAATAGTITLEDTLPPGLTPTEATIGLSTCLVVGQTVKCTVANPVRSGGSIGANIAVDVDPLASGTVLNEASIEGGAAPPLETSTPVTVSPSIASFGFLPGEAGFAAPLSGPDGAAATQAGSHPYQLTVQFGFPTQKPVEEPGAAVQLTAAGTLRDVSADLPPGEIVNPNATPKLCTDAQLLLANCPDGSQIGTASVTLPFFDFVGPGPNGLYNMVPPPGKPSSFGFAAGGVGVFVHILGSVRSDGDYGLSGTSNYLLGRSANAVVGAQVVFWADPSSSSHDAQRGSCATSQVGFCPSQEEGSKTALLTAPVQCTGQPTITRSRADDWEEPGVFHGASYESADLAGNPVSVTGCNKLQFEPTIEARPTTNVADAPTGLDVDVHQPQNEDLSGLATGIMKDTTLTLPEGMSVNPSSADGLGACTEAEANFHTSKASECPDSSKVGSVEVTTPLLDHALPGALYVAKPFQNPEGSLIAIYLSVNDPASGVVANLAGKVVGDPSTGQLRTTFEDNPQLPIEDIRVHLFGGPRAPLRTPSTCGIHTSVADIAPWSAPETPVAHPSDSFPIQVAPAGGSCPGQSSEASNSPSFSAGTIAPVAGAFSPFVLKASRPDGSQSLAGVEATLPPGLSGKLAGIETCTDAQLAKAKAREAPEMGVLEREDPSCPSSSEVGTVDVAAGAGITPLHVTAHAYLTGPYKGAPLSLAIVTPAIAGPFDLGAVVVRTALYVNPETAQIHAVSDPLPQILDGIPLDVRSVDLRMGRPDFTLNPTSCDPMSIAGTLTSGLGQVAAVKSPFQVGGCPQLPYKPKLSIRLEGGTKRAGHPALIATVTAKPGEANTASASVQLPKSAFLDQAHIRTICTRVQFAASQCPPGSIYGKASATTPLLGYPISGNVYLRSSNNKLPDLVVALKGPASQPIEIDLVGRTDSIHGALRNSFEAVPDAPVSSFKLELLGGKRGLVVNSRNLCAKNYRATVDLIGQNGKTYATTPAVGNSCKKAKHRKGKGRNHGGKR